MSKHGVVASEVVNHYSRLWRHLGSFGTRDVIDQFLYNVSVPAPWFKDKLCLDAGCGPGHSAWAMQELGAQCHALDLGFESLTHLRGHLDPGSLVINATVHNLPFASNSFDFVLCSGVLHHTTDSQKGFQELSRITGPGGILYVTFYGKGGLYSLSLKLGRFTARFMPFKLVENLVVRFVRDRKVPNSFMPAKISILDNLYVPIREEFTEKEVRSWFTTAGFKDVIRTKTTIYDYQKPLNRFIHGQGYLQLKGVKSS